MSKWSIESPKHCGSKQREAKSEKVYKKVVLVGSTLLTTIIAIILLTWLILHPTKPEFSLKQADIYQLNYLSSQNTMINLVNSSIQLTLSVKNPNQRVGIYYERVQVYASYGGQPITVYTSVPPFYQGHVDTNLLTASLAGVGLPVAPSFGYQVSRDQTVGSLAVGVKLIGRLRWRVGTWVSGRYRFNVYCVALMPFGPNLPSAPVSITKTSQCSTSV